MGDSDARVPETQNGDADPFIPFGGGEVCADVRRGCEPGFVRRKP